LVNILIERQVYYKNIHHSVRKYSRFTQRPSKMARSLNPLL